MNDKTGHTEEFINEMKAQLEAEMTNLTKELGSLGHKDHGELHGDYEADFPEYGRNDEENVSEMADYQAATSTTDTLEARLVEVKEALERIAQGKYGITDDGQLIPEDRLKANPAAKTLVGGK